MKIWFTEIGEPLPIEDNVRLHRYGMLTKALESYGNEVVWWASSFSHVPKKHLYDEDHDFLVDGVILRLLKGPGYKRNVSYGRIKHQKHFARKFSRLSQNHDFPDLIISPVPTLEVAEAAVNLAKKNRIPILTDIRDEWPDEFVELAPKRLRWLARLFLRNSFKRMGFICKNATGIIAMSERQLQYGLSFAGRERGDNDGVFPHGYSRKPMERSKLIAAKKWWRKKGINQEAFVCCFFGTIGRFFNLETVINAARILSRKFSIQFVLCGDGSRLAVYKKLASDIDSVIFPGWVDSPKIAALMDLSDIGIAPYASNTRMSLPNKPFEYLAGSLPVVSSIQGEFKDILEENQCGYTYDPDSVEQLCSILRKLHSSKDLTKQMGERARALFEKRYSIEKIFPRINEHLVSVVNNYKLLNRTF